jgi:fermentation-respiration switch protein FrsA (DUF1100 family)
MEIIPEKRSFPVRGAELAGRLYMPRNAEKPPVIVMAHGFGAEMAFGLEAFALRFVKEGIAVFAFDYRNFGESPGEPRNLVHPMRHLEDWAGALAFVRSLDSVDSSRIGLWGTSFSGGHVIVTAARDRKVKAVSSQIPFVDGMDAAANLGPAFVLKATAAGLKDVAGSIFGRPFFVPIVGAPGQVAPINQPGNLESYLDLVPENRRGVWQNRCPARILLLAPLYRPIRYAHLVRCPALVTIADRDNLVSPATAALAASKMPDATVFHVDADHFEPYKEPAFSKVADRQAEFFKETLKP